MTTKLFWLILCLSVGACLPATPVKPTPTQTYSDLVISMKRGPCFGTCPVYQLTIYGDGKVTYTGQGYVAVEGTQNIQITPEQIQELATAVENSDFFAWDDRYAAGATDLPSVTLSIRLTGRSKSIWHYGTLNCSGALDKAPPGLCELENKVDEVANANQWIKKK